jgi:hypothetical protein
MAAMDAWYNERGIFRGTIGLGCSLALVVIDTAYGWTDENRFSRSSPRMG